MTLSFSLSETQKYELKSIIQTFLAIFIPMAIVTIETTDFNGLTQETLTALGVALLRSAIKAIWQAVAARFAN